MLVKVLSLLAFFRKLASKPVTSIETEPGAERAARSARAPVLISAAIHCAAK